MLDTILRSLARTFDTTEKLYDRNTGDVAVACGQDGGEVRYVIIRYDCIANKWRAGKKAIERPVGAWTQPLGITESDLITIAKNNYAQTE